VLYKTEEVGTPVEMVPFEMLYGHRCRTPLFSSDTRERKVFGPYILQEAENVTPRVSNPPDYVNHMFKGP
jgi:hypothetical protein